MNSPLGMIINQSSLKSTSSEETDCVVEVTTGATETKPEPNSIIWPDHIRMSGLPLSLCGYNTLFVKTDRVSEGCPEYELQPYTLFVFIGIIGLRIFKSNGQWVACHFYPDYDGSTSSVPHEYYTHSRVLSKLSYQEQVTPFGEWSRGGRIGPA
jgi:hypothetical protein